MQTQVLGLQAGVRVPRLRTPHVHPQAMIGTHHHAWTTGGGTVVSTLLVRTPMTGVLRYGASACGMIVVVLSNYSI